MSTVGQELEKIRLEAGGILRPADVVAQATKKAHPLHSCFEWDNRKAGHEYRLWQARQLIRVSVCVLAGAGEEPIQAYVSLKADRETPEGGYRALADVLKDKDLRRRMLAEALEELRVFEKKYERLQELAPVFAAARAVAV